MFCSGKDKDRRTDDFDNRRSLDPFEREKIRLKSEVRLRPRMARTTSTMASLTASLSSDSSFLTQIEPVTVIGGNKRV
jgi:hypothetical protein